MERTAAFYQRLGSDFEVVSRPGDYAIAERGSLEVQFLRYEGLVPARSCFGYALRVGDAARLHTEFSSAGLPGAEIPRITPWEHEPWGPCECPVIDEGGSLVRVGQELETSPASWLERTGQALHD